MRGKERPVSELGTAFDDSTQFDGKRLHLAVCGSVACYRAADLVRAWGRLGVHVSATISDGARRFVAPLLFESLGAM
ncbi:MAG: bifunctional phosphopantothenoylcysteine decarboxylase/phosphopantothenate--cysteine ligase CoaBC, partial [Desulfovibrio sp.]|nr:bifunctional phosphopantothenoylcysteine decarboxylase/phosphopantothenate--cysteine ligase CoaBC [Desulfovibrio sp.]